LTLVAAVDRFAERAKARLYWNIVAAWTPPSGCGPLRLPGHAPCGAQPRDNSLELDDYSASLCVAGHHAGRTLGTVQLPFIGWPAAMNNERRPNVTVIERSLRNFPASANDTPALKFVLGLLSPPARRWFLRLECW